MQKGYNVTNKNLTKDQRQSILHSCAVNHDYYKVVRLLKMFIEDRTIQKNGKFKYGQALGVWKVDLEYLSQHTAETRTAPGYNKAGRNRRVKPNHL